MKGAVTSLYDSDFYLWTQEAAERLVSGDLTAEDLDHAAEELSDMGKRDRRELQSRMNVLVVHLMKWAAQPQMRETSTWLATINQQRTHIEGLLEQSPSLRALLLIDLPAVYPKAARQAAIETKLPMEILLYRGGACRQNGPPALLRLPAPGYGMPVKRAESRSKN